MQGVLIASAHAAVRKSLSVILQEGRTVHEGRNIAESLSQAAAQKFDLIFIDDVFEDGTAIELARRLHSLGYGIEVIPILLSADPVNLRPFKAFGIRHCICKPFNSTQVNTVTASIEELVDLHDISRNFAEKTALAAESTAPAAAGAAWASSHEVDVREISQRFRRLLSRLANREDLVRAFADALQEQFDVDNVVVLLPSQNAPSFRVTVGSVSEEIKEQFFIPFDEPLVAALMRLGEPVWVHDCDRLGRQNAIAAIRYGERLNAQVICPVLSRGRLLALVGLSRFHRFESSPFLISLVRLFLSFFSEALENAELYERVSAAQTTYRNIIDAMPSGAIAVSGEGRILYLNAAATHFTGLSADELQAQPIERSSSLLADMARETLHSGTPQPARLLRLAMRPVVASTVPMNTGDGAGVLILLEDQATAAAGIEAMAPATLENHELWHNMASAIAHNFKNALVPVKTCAELLPERFDSAAFRNSFFEVVSDNIEKMDGWIEYILRYAQLQVDTREWTVISLHDCVELAMDRVLHDFPDSHISFARDYSSEDYIEGNLEYLVNAFAALIRNAMEAVQDIASPQITLRTQKIQGQAKASVIDNGPGLDSAARLNAFEPFATTKLSGLGLGLAYVQKVAALHKGQVDLQPGAQAGAAFEITLPATEKIPAAQKR